MTSVLHLLRLLRVCRNSFAVVKTVGGVDTGVIDSVLSLLWKRGTLYILLNPANRYYKVSNDIRRITHLAQKQV